MFSLVRKCSKRSSAIKKKEKEKVNAFIWLRDVRVYVFFGIICYPKPTVFLKLRSSKVIRFSEKIMFVGNYPRIILRQTEVSVHIYELPRKKILLLWELWSVHLSLGNGWMSSIQPPWCMRATHLFIWRYHASSISSSHAMPPKA